MEFLTFDQWDDYVWEQVKDIYFEAFGEHSPKPEKVIRNMFQKKLCFLHCLFDQKRKQIVGMALTGSINGSRILLVDYLAVRKNAQGNGVGKQFSTFIKQWAQLQNDYDQILLEVEAEKTPVNLARIAFWQSCGFMLVADYIHHYIWVPEPYQAMVLPLREDVELHTKGKELFKLIMAFHKRSFQQR